MLAQTVALNQLSVFQELKENELEWGKNILEQCKLPHERYAEMKEHMFRAEQELLNGNPINAAKHFNVVRPLLGTCAFELSGKPHPFETAFGQTVLILDSITGGITLVLFLRDVLTRKSSSKGLSN
ncbi:MAG: hypothetical protein ABI337_06295 [Nitrososphaera sp.]